MSLATPSRPNVDAAPAKAGRHHHRLEHLGNRERQRRSLLVGLSSIAMVGALAFTLALTDYHLELAAPGRFAFWMVILAVVGIAIWKAQPWLRFRASDAVSAAERAWPEVGQRLRTSHDYNATPEQVAPANPALVSALERDTEQQVIQHDIPQLGKSWPTAAVLVGCLLAALVWAGMLVASSEWRVATARLLFLPINYSSVTVEPLPEFVEQGDDLVVRVHVDGRPIEPARVRYRPSGSEAWTDVALTSASGGTANESSFDLSASIPDRQADFELQVDAGPHRGSIHPVKVRVPLILSDWVAHVEPPGYTNLPDSEGAPETMRIPEGSTIRLSATYNRAPDQVDIQISSKTEGADPVSAAIEEANATFTVLATGSGMDLAINAVTEDGMTDESILHLNVIPDLRPRLTFSAPDESSEAIPTAELRFTLEARDDYGLSEVGIRYRVDDGDEKTLWKSDADDLPSATAETVTLPLEELGLEYPQAITYYAYAKDNRIHAESESTSELRFVDIRPFSREYQFQQCEGGSCQGECLSLEKLIKQQRQILGRTFVTARQKKASENTAAKLARDENDLRDKTESLTAALEQKVGPMPSLSQAITSMDEAIEDLNESKLADGQVDEEHALAQLVAARRNLRKILKQSNAQSQMCRNVDQQQMDKIRQPKPKDRPEAKKANEESIAEIRRQLEEMAKQQQSFCQSAQSLSQSPSPSSKSNSSPSGSKPSPTPNSPQKQERPNRQQLAKQQRDAESKTRQIQEQLSDGQFGELASTRAAQAAESIARSAKGLETEQDERQAISEAQDAAERLKRLSEHLGRRQEPDFGEKLAGARRQAEQLAQEQDKLSRSLAGSESPSSDASSASQRQQEQLARRAEDLADLVEQIEADAIDQPWQVQRSLIEQSPTQLTSDAAEEMDAAVEQLADGEKRVAAQSGQMAARKLESFAQAAEAVERALGPAQLEQLIDAERKAAALLKDLQRANNGGERGFIKAKSDQLAEEVRAAASRDAMLSNASEQLSNASVAAAQSTDRRGEQNEPSQGTFASSPTTLEEGLRNISQVLQRRIQEAILQGALQQSDENVPPQYVDMVEEYYRTLSEDVE